jgi:hypothetical protein
MRVALASDEGARCSAGLRLAAIERVPGQLWVIDEKRVRIRDGDA